MHYLCVHEFRKLLYINSHRPAHMSHIRGLLLSLFASMWLGVYVD
jgi:hypothetical protein